MYEAMVAIARGRFVDAQALIRRFHELGRRLDDVNVSQTCLLQMTEMLWQLGRAGEIVCAVEENANKHPTLHEWQGALVFINARAGRLAEAREGLRSLAGKPLAGLTYRMNAVIGNAALVEAAWLLGDGESASTLRGIVEPWGERTIVAGYGVLTWGSTARTRGHLAAVLGQDEEAEHWYRQALKWEAKTGNLVWRARTQLAYARMLLAQGKARAADRGAKLLGQVESFARGAGLSALAADVLQARVPRRSRKIAR
jgi:hypothetical protein